MLTTMNEPDFDDLEGPADLNSPDQFECGRWDSDNPGHCALAGTEDCDFECPNRMHLARAWRGEPMSPDDPLNLGGKEDET